MRIGLAQINPCVGDLEGNVDRCVRAVERENGGVVERIRHLLPVVAGHAPRTGLRDVSLDKGGIDPSVARRARLQVEGIARAGDVAVGADQVCAVRHLLVAGQRKPAHVVRVPIQRGLGDVHLPPLVVGMAGDAGLGIVQRSV